MKSLLCRAIHVAGWGLVGGALAACGSEARPGPTGDAGLGGGGASASTTTSSANVGGAGGTGGSTTSANQGGGGAGGSTTTSGNVGGGGAGGSGGSTTTSGNVGGSGGTTSTTSANQGGGGAGGSTSSSSSSSSTSASSSSGGALGLPISIPAEAPYDTWSFIDFPNSRCANGTPTGIAVNPHQGSTKVLVFFMGGGLCWDAATCTGTPPQASNLNGYNKTKMLNFANGVGTFGIFDRTQAQNPLAGYTYVILPYCTGDFHSGDKATTYGATTLEHRGYPNVTEFMTRLVPTFAGSSQVVISGMSAGGWGAAINFGRVHAAFTAAGVPDVPLIDDSGAFLRPTYHTVAMQQAWKAAWGQAPNLPAGCASCDIDSGPGGGLHNVHAHYAATIPGFRGSLISAVDDNVVSTALGRPPGNPNLPCDPMATTPPPCQFHPGLYDLYANVITPSAPGKMRAFFMDGYRHTWMFEPIWNVHPIANSTTIATFLSQQLTNAAGWVDVLP